MDRLQTRTDPLSRQESYSYDANGNLTTATDRRGKVTTLQYDGLNRRTFVGYGTTAGPNYESTISYSYDGGNRLTSVVDSSYGTITPVYDGLNRLTSETTPQGSVSYAYDNAGRRITTTVAGQTAINYTYDNANRLTQVAQGSSNTNFTYDNANRRATMTLPNGMAVTYAYDNNSRITSMTYSLGLSTLGNLTYLYDADGRRTQMGGVLARSGFPQSVTSATYDAGNELTGWNGTTISYDANGNISNDGVATYTWNARNQLTGRGSVTYAYDPFGRRTQNAAGNKLLYDGNDVTQELSGTTPIANRVVGGPDEFFSRTDSVGTYTPIADALGNTLGLADAVGNTTTQYTYDPSGNTTSSGAANSNSFEYTGRENDGNGLYYYRARYYNPVFSRFISEDPSGFSAGVNFYAYANDNPIDFRDPSGLWSTDAHNQIIWNALHPCGVSNDDIYQIQQGSHYVDEYFQDPRYSYMHAMSDGTAGQSPATVQNAMAAYVANTMQEARQSLNEGYESNAMWFFGVAIHPLMDQTSPAHTNYATGNPIPWCGMFTGCSQTFQHGGDSDYHNPWSIENVDALNSNPEVQDLENFIIRTWYHNLTGRGCNCK